MEELLVARSRYGYPRQGASWLALAGWRARTQGRTWFMVRVTSWAGGGLQNRLSGVQFPGVPRMRWPVVQGTSDAALLRQKPGFDSRSANLSGPETGCAACRTLLVFLVETQLNIPDAKADGYFSEPNFRGSSVAERSPLVRGRGFESRSQLPLPILITGMI